MGLGIIGTSRSNRGIFQTGQQNRENFFQKNCTFFIRAFRALPRFEIREGISFEAWLYRIAINACRSRMRRKWYQVLPWPEPAPQIIAEPEEQPERQMMLGEQRGRILETIDSLGEKHRLVVILRYYAGLSNEEIARTLNIPSGTVRSRLHIARKRLRELLAEQDREEENLTLSGEVAA